MLKEETNREIKNLLFEILTITMEIKEKFPELYILLGETPVSLSTHKKDIKSCDFEDYLNTIESLLGHQKK